MARHWTVLYLISLLVCSAVAQSRINRTVPFHVGLILDNDTLVGKMSQIGISMAVDAFYRVNSNYRTRLLLHGQDGKSNTIGATTAAVNLLNDEVLAIIGPQKSTQAVFISDLGNQTQVPIISFSATSPSLSPSHMPYFVRATLNDAAQVKAIASIAKAFGWRRVTLIYEDTNYGAGIVPYLIDALQEVETYVHYRSVIILSANDGQILQELYKMQTMQIRVFIVHMSLPIGTRFFRNVNEANMMAKGYAWISTDGLTSLVDSLDQSIITSMQGLLGVKPYIPGSPALDKFSIEWRRRFMLEHPDIPNAQLSIYVLLAYDVVWSLAMAAEDTGIWNSSKSKPGNITGSGIFDNLEISVIGPSLLKSILKTQFHGLSGQFYLIDGQLPEFTYEIVNVIDNGARLIGFWSSAYGISQSVNTTSSINTSSTMNLASVYWPGKSKEVPKGWQIPTGEKKLKIGVPVKTAFQEFVNVEKDPLTNRTTITGYSIDVFDAVMNALNYAVPYEYIPFEDTKDDKSSSYDALVEQVYLQNYDAVAGDVTITAERALQVDFTMPYTESGVVMIVKVKGDIVMDAWIFLRPFKMDLWLASLAFFVFTGFIIWRIEKPINGEFQGSASKQFGTIFYFIFSTLVYAHRENVKRFCTKFVIIIWLFAVLILTSSYVASLTSMMTVKDIQAAIDDINQLKKNGEYVGYASGSFIKRLLLENHFEESKLVPLSGTDEYRQALSNNTVAAVFHEIPYVKKFLAMHCDEYTVAGPIPTFKTGGLGFVFQRGSPLVPDVSRSILSITEGDQMVRIEKKWIGFDASCQSPDVQISRQRISFRNFWGLFLVTGMTSVLALLITIIRDQWDKLKSEWTTNDRSSSTLQLADASFSTNPSPSESPYNNSSQSELPLIYLDQGSSLHCSP